MDSRCKCSMAISMVGDGCRYCQPQEYIDRLEEVIVDEEIEHREVLKSAKDALVEASRGLIYWEPQTSTGYLNKNRITEHVADEIKAIEDFLGE